MDINFTRPFNNSDWKNPCDGHFEKDLHFKIAVCVINAILTLTASFGNSLILITMWKTSSLHSASNILLSSLAVSDLAVGLISQPFLIASISLCRIAIVDLLAAMLGHILGIASFYTVIAIGVDRLLALQLHLRYEAVVTQFRVKCLVIFIWVLSTGVCGSIQMWRPAKFFYAVASKLCISFLVVNFLVYLRIYLIVRRHQRQIQQQQQQANNDRNILTVTRLKKSALNTFLVFILLMCCYLPYSVYLAHGNVFNLTRVSVTTVTLVYLNSSLNPLLYCWRDRQIRTAVKQLVCG